jgi:TolB-like protein
MFKRFTPARAKTAVCPYHKVALILALSFLVNGMAAQAKERIAVMDFQSSEQDMQIARMVTDTFVTELVKIEQYEVLERAQLEKVIQELQLSESDDFDDSQVLEIGSLAKTRKIIIGSISQDSKLITLNVRVINVETGSIVSADKLVAKTTKELLQSIEKLAGTLFKPEKPLSTFEVRMQDTRFKRAFAMLVAGSSMALAAIPIEIVSIYYFWAVPGNYSAGQFTRNQLIGIEAALITGMAVGGLLFIGGVALDIISIIFFHTSKKSDKKISLILDCGPVTRLGLRVRL